MSKKVLVSSLFVLSAIGWAPRAHAFEHLTVWGSWPQGNVHFRINPTSFTTIPNLGVSSDEARRIVASSFNVWRERTGANLTFIDDGDTTAVPTVCGGTTASNGFNDVVAVNGCHPREVGTNFCRTAGEVFAVQVMNNADKTPVELDLCIFRGDFTWKAKATELVGSPFNSINDLYGITTHEVGHLLGLAHTNQTVMAGGGNVTPGTTLQRFPSGDDFAGIRSFYGPVGQSYRFRTLAPGTDTWSAERGDHFLATGHVNAALGKAPSGHKIVVASLDGGDQAGTRIWFDNAVFPLGIQPSWQSFSPSQTSLRPPAVAGKADGSSVWVAALSNKKTFINECSNITVLRSTDAFATMSATNLTNDCTIHDPALAYDPVSDRFILLYVQRSSSDFTVNDVIIARTASAADTSTWTSPQNLGIKTLDAPALACRDASSQCLFTYLTADTNIPFFVNRSVTVSASTGQLSLGGLHTASDFYFKTIAAGVRTFNSAPQWIIADNYNNDVADYIANGSYSVFTLHKTAVPFTDSGWNFLDEVPWHRPALASSAPRPEMYMFYVK
jgi:hypothetical protein